MPRKAKGSHTCPEVAGEQNMTPENLKSKNAKSTGDEAEFLRKTLPIFKRSIKMRENRQDYGGKWTREELENSLIEFFEYCTDNDLEPSPPMLTLWLGTNKQTLNEWRKGKTSDNFKADVIGKAYALMEMRYFGKLDKYAVSNIFKLKTVFNYVEPAKVEITNKTELNVDGVNEAIKNLGIDK